MVAETYEGFSHQTNTDSTVESSTHDNQSNTQQLEAASAQYETSSEGYSEPDTFEVEHKDYYARTDIGNSKSSSEGSNTKTAEQQRQPVLSRMTQWLRKPKQDSSNPPQYQQTSSSTPRKLSSESESSEQYWASHHPTSGQDDIENLQPPAYLDEARQLVRTLTEGHVGSAYDGADSGTETPAVDRYIPDLGYIPAPRQYKPSIFATILTSKLDNITNELTGQRDHRNSLRAGTKKSTPIEKTIPEHSYPQSQSSSGQNSGTSTPVRKVKWYDGPGNGSMADLVRATLSSAGPAVPNSTAALPKAPASKSTEKLSSAIDFTNSRTYRHKKSSSTESSNKLITEVADIIARRSYLIKLCSALMKHGAPTHRMEAYLTASSRALSIEADFLYMPGAMFCTFIDHSILANNVEVVRKSAGLDFGRLKDVFNVYKCVIHEKFTASEGTLELEKIERRPDRHNELFRILMFGLASATVGPFSFNTRPIDSIPIFVLGCILGFMQIKVVPRSEQFSNVFEVFACVLFAFVARALGSIRWGNGDYIFCFSGVAQSSIAMILPGFMVLNSALELQGKSILSGSVRMIYAIIYVLFLGFGLLVGTTIFGLIKRDAVDSVTCQVPDWWTPEYNYKLLYTRFIWAPLFACCLALVYQAKWRQLPVMALIAVAGHQANYWISTQLSSNVQVANAIGAFVIGCLANLYSRLFHGLAAAAMLPAIYCQVPGGLAASGSLVAGLASSNQITGNSSSVSIINNGTQGFVAAQDDPNSLYGGTIYNSGYGMVQVSIGISVGLYLSALVVYPFGKRNSGLFSF